MNEYNKQIIFLEYLKKTCGIYWAIYNEKEELEQSFSDDRIMEFELIWKETIETNKRFSNTERYYLYTIGSNIYIWSFYVENKYYLFGPVATDTSTPMQLHEFYHHYKIKAEKMAIPRFLISQLEDFMGFSFFGITGNILQENLSIQMKKENKPHVAEKANYDLYRVKAEKETSSYEAECAWLEGIEKGIVQDLTTIKIQFPHYRIGTVSRKSDFKQIEYLNVCGIVLSTRAAIRGGVPPSVAYETSDILLQKLSKSSNLYEMQQNLDDYNTIFSKLVQQYQKKKEGAMVELCKEYIAKHLYKNFSIQQMADELAMNRSHMSRKFSDKTDCTIQEYIRCERLAAAANLLKHSEESISQISDYLYFSSPSRFSSYFKKKYGVSPMRFREENKLIEFIEKK